MAKTTLPIKKHGMNLYLSPQIIYPYKNIEFSDTTFGKLNKDLSHHPYKNASIDAFIPLKPWAAPAAFATIENDVFPTVQEMDNEFDQWQGQSSNPFTYFEKQSHSGDKTIAAHLSGTDHSTHTNSAQPLPQTTPFAIHIRNMISSTDKLMFLSISSKTSERREWYLVHVNMPLSLHHHPQCM